MQLEINGVSPAKKGPFEQKLRKYKKDFEDAKSKLERQSETVFSRRDEGMMGGGAGEYVSPSDARAGRMSIRRGCCTSRTRS